jgi:hypothetical protein
MKNIIKFITIVAMGLIVNSCYYDVLIENEYIPVDDANAPEVSYEMDIIPLWNQCVGCHDGTTPPNLTANVSYNELLNGYVVPEDSDSSILYKSLLGIDGIELMPPDAMWPDEKITLVRNWINQGALNN